MSGLEVRGRLVRSTPCAPRLRATLAARSRPDRAAPTVPGGADRPARRPPSPCGRAPIPASGFVYARRHACAEVRPPLPLLLALQSACGGPASPGTGTTGDATSGGESSDSSGPATAGGTTTGASTDGTTTASPTTSTTAPGTTDPDPTTGTTGDEAEDIAIGEWTDLPGACPDGTTRVDLTTVAELGAASRGEGEFADDGPGTCYFIHDGDYAGEDPLLYVVRGGTARAPIVFVGESRDGVRLRGRVTFAEQGSHVVLRNMTFDIGGFAKADAFNTASVEAVEDITIDHVTFTGDCQTGEDGGHIESNHAKGLRIEACLIERFGRCGPEGHQDHGIYLASGSDITVVNNVIRGNASRGSSCTPRAASTARWTASSSSATGSPATATPTTRTASSSPARATAPSPASTSATT
ncbi:right-handed parallel beta-helix repeat-containing protein [Nannocystis pusilla]|uniref:right-handed parallel beta-helix repeat-containing protein n=1 Tax=Nannocystis pusilla TaxID=889268 RepID=UPI003B80951E